MPYIKIVCKSDPESYSIESANEDVFDAATFFAKHLGDD